MVSGLNCVLARVHLVPVTWITCCLSASTGPSSLGLISPLSQLGHLALVALMEPSPYGYDRCGSKQVAGSRIEVKFHPGVAC